MYVYSNLELFEIVMIYAKNESYPETAREFQRRFPNSLRPSLLVCTFID